MCITSHQKGIHNSLALPAHIMIKVRLAPGRHLAQNEITDSARNVRQTLKARRGCSESAIQEGVYNFSPAMREPNFCADTTQHERLLGWHRGCLQVFLNSLIQHIFASLDLGRSGPEFYPAMQPRNRTT